jgi:DNA-binding MarR family transcriptional regulator
MGLLKAGHATWPELGYKRRMTKTRAPATPLTTSRDELLVDGQDQRFRDLVRDLVTFSGQLQEIRAGIARGMGLTPPQYNILMVLAHMPADGVTVRELAEALRVSVPFAVTETGRLEQAGYLRKTPDLQDRRRVNVALTEKARTALADIAPAQRRVNDVLFGSLSQGDFAALGQLTRGLLDSCADALVEARRTAKAPTR